MNKNDVTAIGLLSDLRARGRYNIDLVRHAVRWPRPVACACTHVITKRKYTIAPPPRPRPRPFRTCHARVPSEGSSAATLQ